MRTLDLRRLLKGPLALICLLACVPIARAADAYASGTDVVVNGVTVLRMKASNGKFSPAERAQIIAENLSKTFDGDVVRTQKVEAEYRLYVGSTLCFTITKADAKAGKATVAGLARQWARSLSAALALPPLKLETNVLEVPAGGSRTVKLLGSLARKAQIKVNDEGIVRTVFQSPEIEVTGRAVGVTTVSVDAGTYVETISVRVRPYAANLPQSLTAEVVGTPADAATVEGALETAIRSQLNVPALGKVSYDLPKVTSLALGESRTIRVPVRVSANDCFPISGNAVVTVRNTPVPKVSDAELWYSNNPETVRRAQPLFSATLRQGAPARLLYHHLNATDFSLFLRVQLVNQSDKAAKVVVIPGDTPPDRNPVRAGLVAGLQYFQSWLQGSGEVITVPPKSSLPISLRRLSNGQTSSGLCGLRLMEGPTEVLVRTDAYPPFDLDSRWTEAINSTTPWRSVGCPPINQFDLAPYQLSEHVYPNPNKVEEVRYEVGGRYGFVRIGQRAIIRQDQNSRLEGNFGVIYNIKGQVANPTDRDAEIEVVFEASAGYSGAVFSIDGAVVKAGPIPPKAERQIVKFRLAAGDSKSLNMYTIPLSGSSYPATITIRPIMRSFTKAEEKR